MARFEQWYMPWALAIRACQRAFSLMKLGLFFVLFLTLSFSLKAKNKDFKKIEKKYFKLHRQFSKKVCRPGTEERFWKLFKSYRGDGLYIPVLLNGDLDKKTLNRFIPEIEEKKKWIDKLIFNLSKVKNLKKTKSITAELERAHERLLELKKKYDRSRNTIKQNAIKNRSRLTFLRLREVFSKLMKEVPFLLSYRHPVDHFELRESYDLVKKGKTEKEKQRSNEIYFYRRIVQDGAQNRDHTRSDTFLRANLDTIALSLRSDISIYPEDLRYDMASALRSIKRHIRIGKKKQIDRLKEWRGRVLRHLTFYRSLRKNRVKINGHIGTGEQLIEAKSKAKEKLETFSLLKQKEVYDFWKSQSIQMQALFSLETILFNEVGPLDGKGQVERRDVSQVVINRSLDGDYNTIEKEEPLFSYFKGHKDKVETNPWLNLLFKEGEFSFTYFFIHGNVRIYCPDLTKRGRRLRRENVKIALESLRRPNHKFKGIRYFSRASMLGRISMNKIWSDFESIKERPGKRVLREKSLKKRVSQGKYDYLYYFKDDNEALYEVLLIGKRTYAYRPDLGKFYYYRSPHLFRYFKKGI